MKLSNYSKKNTSKVKWKGDQLQLDNKNDNGKIKVKGEKHRKIIQQDKWKLEDPEEGNTHTINKKNNTYHWYPNHAIWTAHKPDGFEMTETSKGKTDKNNTQQEGGMWWGKTFTIVLATVTTKTI